MKVASTASNSADASARELGLWDLQHGEESASVELANDAEHDELRLGSDGARTGRGAAATVEADTPCAVLWSEL